MESPRREDPARLPLPVREVPVEVVERVAQHFDRRLGYAFAGWPHGQSLVWRATDGRGPALYVKVHPVPYLYERHLRAFREWVPHLPCATPELLLCDEALHLMVFAELPGQPLEQVDLDAIAELQAYATAGEVARAYHEIPVLPRGRPADPVATVRKRLERQVESVAGLVDRGTLDWATSLGPEMSIFADEQLVPCHPDFSPRNWLVADGGGDRTWALIDFERSRLDFPYIDFQPMAVDHWLKRPDRREACFDGYGRRLSADEERKLSFTILGICLGTTRWGTDHGDAAFAEEARRTLAHLRAEL